jgi:ATPase family associated with various cellular activities (AAA)
MSNENYNKILDREKIEYEIKQILDNFDENCKNINFKKGIYIYGSTGCGKTEFITSLLKKWNYDIIKYDAGDVRNKSLIDTITSNNISNKNILDMMNKKVKRIVIVMDEIDGMNNGDKGGITSLIKLIRQKKTKKQKSEDITLNPIICIGNYFIDKKIRELMKVCNVFELKTPSDQQISNIIDSFLPSNEIKPQMLKYIQGDLRKLQFIKKLYENKPTIFEEHSSIFNKILKTKTHIEDSKKTTQLLIKHPIPIEQHNQFMNETDRTIVALLWHENIVDSLEGLPINRSFPFYSKILDNMCYADYIDRITFQNQIWQFNEMSSMMKTFYNNKLFHDYFPEHEVPDDIRFTKVLTKYSTEYNNQLFISVICRELDMDKKDAIALFQEIRLIHGADFLSRPDLSTKVDEILENLHINKLDMKRIYRYLDKNVKKDVPIDEDLDDEL